MFINSESAQREGGSVPAATPIKVAPRDLRISPNRPSAPAATVPATGPGKGGKGGEGGEPPLPPSNAVFLASVMRGVSEDARAVVCTKSGDPTDGGWIAEAAKDVDRQCPVDRNNYLNCSTFVPEADGSIQARKDRFGTFHILVLDDVGTKIDRQKLGEFIPTWEIETSPGNSQIGIRLAVPISDPAQVKRLQDAVIAAGLCDPGAAGLARWVRLPNAINGKAKYRSDAGERSADAVESRHCTIEAARHARSRQRRVHPDARRKSGADGAARQGFVQAPHRAG
jgi:hypothetical protein